MLYTGRSAERPVGVSALAPRLHPATADRRPRESLDGLIDGMGSDVDEAERLPQLDAAEVFPGEPRLPDQRPDEVLPRGAGLPAAAPDTPHPARRPARL